MSSLQTFFVNNKNDLILLDPNISEDAFENIEGKQGEILSETAQKFLNMCVDTYKEWNGDLSTRYVECMQKFAKDLDIEDDTDLQCPLSMMIITIASFAKKQLAEETDRKVLEKDIEKAEQEHSEDAKNLPARLKVVFDRLPAEKRKLAMEDHRQQGEARLERSIAKLKNDFESQLDDKLAILAAANKTSAAWEKVWNVLSNQEDSLQKALEQPLKDLLECHYEFAPYAVKFQTIQDEEIFGAIGGVVDVMADGFNTLSAQLEYSIRSFKLEGLVKSVTEVLETQKGELISILDSLNKGSERAEDLANRASNTLKALKTCEDETKRETKELLTWLENYKTSSQLEQDNVNQLNRSCKSLMLVIKKMRENAEMVKSKVQLNFCKKIL